MNLTVLPHAMVFISIYLQIKKYFSFKNKYTITSIQLISHNKRFLHLFTGAPGSTHDARLLRCSFLFHRIANGEK